MNPAQKYHFKDLATALCLSLILFLAAVPFDSGAVSYAADTPLVLEKAKNPDPWEKVNRKIYRFNEKVDHAVLRPVARGYVKHVPQKVRRGVKNFGANLREPTTIINDLLQGKVGQAGRDTLRFLINSTVGLLGIFDVASRLDLERHREDYGQTLAKWGVPAGPYLVLPFLGPSNLRDATGLIPQYAYTDLTAGIDDDAILWSLYAVRAVDTRSDLLKADKILENQLDPYVFLRESYTQQRIVQINDGVVEESEDEFLDEILGEEK